MPFFDYQAPPVPPAGRPSLVFDERLDLRRGGQTFEIRHIPPAHTSGDAVVYCPEADVLHAGDLYFNGLYPFIDVHNGGGIDGMIAAVESLIILCGPDTKVVPGHGPLSDRDGLGAYLRMLKGTRAEVARQMKGGKDLAAVAAAGPTAEWDGVWGDGFLKPEQFVQLVFDSLERDGI